MAYFKINDVDFSEYVNSLKVTYNYIYNSQINAGGNTIVDYINKKRVIEVGFIPMDEATMKTLMTQIGHFNVNISYKEPESENKLASANCIMPNNSIDYYTIQVSKVLFKAFTITFQEL